ncbi:MAG: flagellar hook-length control protein FliK [Actinomycetospora chiangmaiensis]|nr:flagellar hook-length control protein FliK [Actinomycetospora chiangmaiensis]
MLRHGGLELVRPLQVEVLGRAVHFKPVLANAVPAEAAQPDPAAQGTAAQTGIQTTAEPAQTKRATWPDLMAAAAAKTATKAQVPPRPEPRSLDPAPAARGLEAAGRAVLEDIRAVTEVAETVLDAAGRRESEGLGARAPQDPAGAIPALPTGSLTTIAAAIKDEIDRVGEPAPTSRAQADPGSKAAPDGPLRLLRIQLRPEELGTVMVELRLANGQLETHLRASRPETAALLHRDAAILTDLLKQAHYRAEVTVGQARPSDGGGFSGGSPAQGQQPSSEGGARPGQGGERQRQAAQQQTAGRRDGERTDEAVRPRDSGVYL